jgi:ERCC4-type nuclease
MILIDSRTGSKELAPYIRRIGVPCELANLEFGDCALEGNGPKGPIAVGIERKTLHDMLHSVDDSRYSAHQRPGMLKMYDKSFLIVEGNWRPHDPDGTLMESHNGGSWGQCRYRSQRVMYSKLRRYLFSVQLSGVPVLYTRDLFHTAYDICECFHYFQKRWESHTSLIEVQKLNIPALDGKPKLVRRWAADLENVGTLLSIEAERQFKTPISLAQSSESDWLRIKGIGVKSARNIVKEIWGIK